MYVLYLDDSGSIPNRNEDYFVLGGVCLHESQIHWVTEQLNALAAEIDQQQHRDNFPCPCIACQSRRIMK
ncbi:DUF3800 domain-containing protein [bacterium]|nr:DUF3800 domain-containing protein [bacterium]